MKHAQEILKEVHDEFLGMAPKDIRSLINNDAFMPRTIVRSNETITVDFNIVEEGENYIIQISAGGAYYTKGSMDVVVPKED